MEKQGSRIKGSSTLCFLYQGRTFGTGQTLYCYFADEETDMQGETKSLSLSWPEARAHQTRVGLARLLVLL